MDYNATITIAASGRQVRVAVVNKRGDEIHLTPSDAESLLDAWGESVGVRASVHWPHEDLVAIGWVEVEQVFARAIERAAADGEEFFVLPVAGFGIFEWSVKLDADEIPLGTIRTNGRQSWVLSDPGAYLSKEWWSPEAGDWFRIDDIPTDAV